jgi:hypothetical protein
MGSSSKQRRRKKLRLENELEICIDAYPDGELFDPAALPPPVDLITARPNELAMAWRNQWQPGQEIRIRFVDGELTLWERVEHVAREWLRYANLRFNFGNHAEAEIRITFQGRGYQSVTGTKATRVPDPFPTMQLGDLTADSDERRLRRSVLHEFGHAIGCIHEQASPAVQIPWDVEKVYEFYRRTQGWDQSTTRQNILHRYSRDETRFSHHDPKSIMQYPVPKSLTVGGFEIGWNEDLSHMDKSFIARMYPS